jgi:hypothetical protein
VGLDAAAGRAIPADEVIRAVEETLAERFAATLSPSDYTPAELTTADRLQRERFQPVE